MNRTLISSVKGVMGAILGKKGSAGEAQCDGGGWRGNKPRGIDHPRPASLFEKVTENSSGQFPGGEVFILQKLSIL